MRQESILLRTVETVDLVDEQERAAPLLPPRLGLLEHLAQVRHARLDGRQLLEMKIGDFGEEPRHGGLAGARRTPEDHRTEASDPHHAAQHAVAEKMILADHLVEGLRAQAVRERTWRAIGEPSSLKQRRRALFHGSALDREIEDFSVSFEL